MKFITYIYFSLFTLTFTLLLILIIIFQKKKHSCVCMCKCLRNLEIARPVCDAGDRELDLAADFARYQQNLIILVSSRVWHYCHARSSALHAIYSEVQSGRPAARLASAMKRCVRRRRNVCSTVLRRFPLTLRASNYSSPRAFRSCPLAAGCFIHARMRHTTTYYATCPRS